MRKQSEITYRGQAVSKIIDEHKYGKNLYHYTSMASFVGILSKKELWLGNVATMNDKSEIVDFIEKLQMAVSMDIDPSMIDDCNIFFEKLYRRLKNEYPFAACFSKLNDNAAQWERYADDARGVCIVFNTSTFMNLFYYSGALFNEVFYEYDIKQHKHYKILKDYFNTGVLKEFNSEIGEMDNLLACAYMHKHQSFCTESEIRLTTLWNQEIAQSEFSFEMVNGRLKKILKVSLEKLCSDENIDIEQLIDSIVIAPRSEQNEQDLKEYIEYLGYKELCNKITKSQCPLR